MRNHWPASLFLPLFIVSNIILFSSCTSKNDSQDYDPQSDPSISGTIYFHGDDSIRSLDIQSGRFNWTEKIVDNTGTAFTAMNADSGYLYKSSTYFMASYNMNTGKWLWNYSFGIAYSGGGGGVVEGQIASFADSMMYFVQNYLLTGVNLYCLNKRTGILSWKQKVLYGSGSIYVGKPLIVGASIFSLGNNSNNQQVIFCFNRITGQLQWQKIVEGIFVNHLRNFENSVIGWGTDKAICLNIQDGSVKWQINLPVHSGSSQYSYDVYQEGNQTLLARSRGTTSSFSWINNIDGSLADSYTLPKDYTRCGYSSGKLYLFHAQSDDTVLFVDAYDARHLNPLWKCKFPVLFVNSPKPWYYTDLVIADDKAIVGETFGEFPTAKTQFNIINTSTGKLEKQVAAGAQGFTRSFIVVKNKKIYGSDQERQ